MRSYLESVAVLEVWPLDVSGVRLLAAVPERSEFGSVEEALSRLDGLVPVSVSVWVDGVTADGGRDGVLVGDVDGADVLVGGFRVRCSEWDSSELFDVLSVEWERDSARVEIPW